MIWTIHMGILRTLTMTSDTAKDTMKQWVNLRRGLCTQNTNTTRRLPINEKMMSNVRPEVKKMLERNRRGIFSMFFNILWNIIVFSFSNSKQCILLQKQCSCTHKVTWHTVHWVSLSIYSKSSFFFNITAHVHEKIRIRVSNRKLRLSKQNYRLSTNVRHQI